MAPASKADASTGLGTSSTVAFTGIADPAPSGEECAGGCRGGCGSVLEVATEFGGSAVCGKGEGTRVPEEAGWCGGGRTPCIASSCETGCSSVRKREVI